MKYVIALVCLGFISVSYAAQTSTTCASMNDSRETQSKDVSTANNTKNVKASAVKM